ncbi:tubulin polyglutamylase complex subunit 1 [Scleropages formosus]|uniref:Inositol-3-phosphate synthase 1 n=1 Tax=Scleropages formosus TaxID=113540 RepID=A0A8C9W9V7_SCLFO|nr:tubulin polyglutamylase complex subunit 1 [Scleropages formosus]
MAEKRRPRASARDSQRELLAQLGAEALLRGALLRLLELRPEDPLGFLAQHFANEAAEAESAAARGGGERGERGEQREQHEQHEQRLERALWHLRLAHHSQRSAFNNNVRLAYELLTPPGQRPAGGVRGRLYTELLGSLCSEAGARASTTAPLLRRVRCQEHEAVPFELFRQGVLTCAVFSDYVRRSRSLYSAVRGGSGAPAQRALCQAVLEALRDALDTPRCADSARYLEASAKIAPCTLAQAMASARDPDEGRAGPTMDPREFEEAAAALFIARVQTVS